MRLRDHGARLVDDLGEQLDVRALQGAVLGDVGDDVAGGAVGVEGSGADGQPPRRIGRSYFLR